MAVICHAALHHIFFTTGIKPISPTADLGIRSVNSVHTALVALPLAYFATNTYLDFFPNRLSLPGAIILVAGCVGVALSGAIVSVHAMKIACANAIHALRYE